MIEWEPDADEPFDLTTDTPESFTCPRCGAVSYHPMDVRHGYCGRCHDFTGSGRDA